MTTTLTPSATRATWREWTALAVLMMPVLLVSIDNTVLSFALPEIATALEPTASEQLWIVDAYPLVLAGLLIAMGNLGDRYGRKRVLLVGATGFGVVSVLIAFAPTAFWLIIGRAVLGFFGAMLMPSTLSLLRTTFVDRAQRRLAIAIWATAFSIGSAVGPAVGGLLLQHAWWGIVFLIAVPMLAPLLVLGPFLIRESRDPAPGPIDGMGIALSMATLAPLAAAIKHAATSGIDWLTIVLLVVAVAAGFAFVRRMARAAHPMLDVSLLRERVFGGAVLVNLLSVIGLVGFLFFLTQHLQLVERMTTLDAALVLAPGILAMVVSGLAVVWIVKRFQPGTVIAVAATFSFAAYALVAVIGQDISVGVIMLAFVLLGIGIGAAETLSNDLIVSSVPEAKAGAASGVSETAYELGAVLGTSVLGGILTAAYRAHLSVPAGVSADDAQAASETLSGAVRIADRIGGELGESLRNAATAAFDEGVVATALSGAGLMAIAIAVAVVFLRTRRSEASKDRD